MSLINTRVVFPRQDLAVLEEQTLAEPLQADEILIKNSYSLISPGTELAMYTQSHIAFGDPQVVWARYPYYPGYASVGRVQAVGQQVDTVAVGDTLLYLGPHQAYGVLRQGDLAVKVAAAMPLEWAPFASLAQIAHTALWVSQAQPGERVAVVGLGLVGNLAAQVFRAFGAAVIGLDLVPFRRDRAARVGIGQALDPGDDLTGAIRAATAGRGADSVVEATGAPEVIGPALRAVRPRGEVILLGSPRGAVTIDVYYDIHRNGAVLKGAHVGLLPRRARDGGPDRQTIMARMLEMIRRRELVVAPLISDIIQPQAVDHSYQTLLTAKDRSLGVLIQWSD